MIDDTLELFRTSGGQAVRVSDFRRALETVDAGDGELLFVHSEMSFGMPSPALGRRGLLEAIYSLLRETAGGAVAVPTFTFSFCNGTPFDLRRSRSEMGALNEYIRTEPSSIRSRDPLMSIAIAGGGSDLVKDLPPSSLGVDSTFDRIHRMGRGARFLFLGVNPAKCFTYIHYVERKLGIPYRYDRTFSGSVIDGEQERQEDWTLFVRYKGVVPTRSSRFVSFMRDEGILREATLGDASIATVSEPDGFGAVQSCLERDINYFLDHPYPEHLEKEFHAERMVAL